MSAIPEHRAYVNKLIEDGIIDHYVVTMESQKAWITFTAESKQQVEEYLIKTPIYKSYFLPNVRINLLL